MKKKVSTTEKTFPFAEYLRLGEIKKLVHRFNDELKKKNSRSISITSLEPSEGRTFLTAVLALGSAVFLKKKVLVVDTSSQPHQGNLYLDRIFGDATMEKYVDLIKPNREQGIQGESADFELKELLDHYLTQYDLVLFDTTAINESNTDSMDPIIVSKTAGSTIMILSQESINSGDFKKVYAEFNEWEIPILGTVYNFWGNR